MTSKYRALAWVIAASSIIATCMVFTFRSYGQIEAAANANKYAHEGVSASHEFMDHLKDAEISQRGYVLTGEESQLMLYLALKGNLPHELKALRLRAVAAEASVHLNATAYLLDAKLAEMARAVVLRQSKTFGAMTSQAYGGEGSGLMDGIRAEFQAFDRIQGEEQLQSMAEFDASMRRMLGGIVSMSVLGVLFALYFVNQFFCAARAQVRARQLDAVYRNVASENAAQRVLQDSAAVVRQSSALQHAIFNSANFSYISTDAQGLIQVFNMGSEMMLDYTSEEMVGKTTPASICGADELTLRAQQLRGDSQAPELSAFEALVYKAARGMEDIFEVNYCHKSGAIVPVILSVNPLYDADNTVIGYLFIGIDNRTRRRLETERTHLNQVLRDRNTDLESARAVAERANQAKSDFLSSMSHELRSPLNAILGFAQLMESGLPAPTPQQQANIEQILRAGWYLLELINEVLDLALVE
ncbi:MAG: hypothetical protein RL032_722, partial [Pseudomonadota bacterium]